MKKKLACVILVLLLALRLANPGIVKELERLNYAKMQSWLHYNQDDKAMSYHFIP